MNQSIPGTLPDSDVLQKPQIPFVEAGTVGWDGEDDVADLGSEDNDGTTLIKVQLFRGIDPTREPVENQALGHKILARLSGFPFWAIPPKGMQCYVAFPAGFATTPGAGVIIALPGANPFVQFSATRAKIDVGRDQDLVIKGRSVTLVMHNPDDPDGQEDFISITKEGGIQMGSRDGLGVVIKDGAISLFVPDSSDAVKSVVTLNKDEIALVQGAGSAIFKLVDGEIQLFGANVQMPTAGVNLGVAATATTGAAYATGGPSALAAWMTSFTSWATLVGAVVPPNTGRPVAIPPVPPPPLLASATVNVQP